MSANYGLADHESLVRAFPDVVLSLGSRMPTDLANLRKLRTHTEQVSEIKRLTFALLTDLQQRRWPLATAQSVVDAYVYALRQCM